MCGWPTGRRTLYAPLVHVRAALAFLGWWAGRLGWQPSLMIAIAVLIITCPCALGLAVPAVQVVASGLLFKKGVLLNSGDALERLASADTIVFDKTGTLTLPEAELANREAISANDLRLGARMALASRHPLAAALARADTAQQPVANVREIAGLGVEAVVDGVERASWQPCVLWR